MRWDARQVRMLEEMGVRLWPAPGARSATDGSTLDGPAPDAPTVDEAASESAASGPTSERSATGTTQNRMAAAVAPEAAAAAGPRAVAAAAPPAVERRAVMPPAAPVAAPAAAVVARRERPEIDTMDWPVLRTAVAGCTACPLCASRRRAVFGAGHQHAHWLIVGEAPGEQEDQQGEPFVGKAGQLLDQMLQAIGLSRAASEARDDTQAPGVTPALTDPRTSNDMQGRDDAQALGDQQAPGGPRALGDARAPDAARTTRSAPATEATALALAPATATATADPARQVYVTNVLKCHPPLSRNPSPDEIARCEPFLRRQVALLRPRVILALGRFAVQSLLQTDEPLGRLRGRVHSYRGVPVIVSYHPAYLLRQPADKARAWDDLCLACEVVEQIAPTIA